MNVETITAVSDALANLDLEPEGLRHAKFKQDLVDIGEARKTATARHNEIAKELREDVGPQGDHVASALLRGEDPSDAARGSSNRKDLEDQAAALSAGLKALNIRERDTYNAIRNAESDERSKITPAFQPLLDLGKREVAAALNVIAQHYAVAEAIHGATRYGAEKQVNALGDILATAIGEHNLVPFENVDVPPEVVGLLEMLKDRCTAHKVYVLTAVPNCPEAKFPVQMAIAVDTARRAAAA
ncbi:hypothetical protein [Sphingopyxis sp.]|uniref:hypothetical protein n=1 Tax=Sphingopyxis sp. TaxID=1908224 RepID=UPI001DFFB7C1|nr:hypothetical protein [Sphingopyxis sp.]MBW8294741.1 hypothetical protein [Sphingopyxis sp.]